MNYLGKVFSNFKEFYNDINPATLTGAIDVVVVEQSDGTLVSSPFHVRFGKMGVLRSREKMVDIVVNGEPIGIHMKLGESGEAFFVEEVEMEDEEIPSHLATSPIVPMPDLEKEIAKMRVSGDPIASIGVQTEGQAEEQLVLDPLQKHAEEAHPKPRRSQAKRRKKLLGIHRSCPRSSDNALQIDRVAEPEIFQMDEDFGIETDEGMTRSTSLPLDCSGPRWSDIPGPGVHPFSDGELSPLSPMSPSGSRPPSPKSDSEVEIRKHDATSQTDQVSWNWGELPSVEPSIHDQSAADVLSDEEDNIDKKEENKRSMLGNMLSFMRYNHKIQKQQQQPGQTYLFDDGISLDKLQELDPERAALYFPKTRPVEEIPCDIARSQTPSALKDEDAESGNGPSLPQSPHSQCLESDPEDCSKPQGWTAENLAISLCGGLLDSEEQLSHARFLQFQVTFEDFAANPYHILQNPKLVVRLDDKFYNWQTSAPILISLALFQKTLPEGTIAKLANDHMPKKKKNYSWWTYWGGGRAEAKQQQSPPTSLPSPLTLGLQKPEENLEHKGGGEEEPLLETIALEMAEPAMTELVSSVSSEADLPEIDLDPLPALGHKDKWRKTLRLSSEQLVQLKLRRGPNEVSFSVTTAYQGTTRCKCHIYFWHYNDRVVISDIDGTITKSDVLGHILPILGRDWAHSGVAKLFSRIHANGYNFLYLSARAIGQAHLTREYLRGLRQGDLCLPDGPLLLNPTSLLNALHREVIEKKPEEFKINCLRDIQALFPKNPFHAGFGNKVNDTYAYCTVSVPASRIFTINHHGDLRLALTHTYHSSYTNLSDMADQVFPSYKTRQSTASDFANSDEYSSFTYWRLPPPEIDPSLIPPPPKPSTGNSNAVAPAK